MAKNSGLKITRRYTSPGDPYKDITWEKRTSKITNPDGSVVFEMTDVEIPSTWSQVATDIMVSKYFRKAGVPQVDESGNILRDDNGEIILGPESSSKQVFDRLAETWRHWGEKTGYFASKDDAQAFEDELKYMLATQMAAPNSPQWFNTGLNHKYDLTGPAQGFWYVDPKTEKLTEGQDSYSRPQPHACFIQSIDDDLVNEGGIMDLWVKEARLFKFGSGTGTNFSNLRGEGEKLSGGGVSSGVMSFLKIGDSAAGAIKSGGTTRRAAKMVILDLDHPDIENFVEWKAVEEDKARALIAAGYPSDFNGEAYATVSGQNSNNSVRVPTDFIKAVEKNEDWELIGRTNGDVTITPNGTGSIKLGAMKFVGTTMSSDDSTQITIAENIQTTGTINVAGAATLSTSLTFASGATVTTILDEDAMGTNSATALATQQSIKAYVDSQVTASDLDFQGDSGGALSVDLDSQTFTVTGGTGIDTSGSGQTLTVAIDSTVATLTGSQTLTNKVLTSPTINGATMTGNVTVDNLIFNDTDISTASNGNLTLNPGGTGTIQLHANTAVTGTASVSGTLTTADITTTGNTTVSGNSTVAGTLTVQGSINADTIVSNSNGDITIDPAGTGAIVLTGPITATGTQTTTGQLNVDNLRLDGNTLSATSGGITLSPATGQNVAVGGTNVKLTATEANFTLMEATTVRTDTLSTDTSNADLTIGTQGTGNIVVDTGVIARTGDLELDVSGNLYLDADGGTMFLQDGTAGTFGQFIRAGSNDLTIASGSTQALIFTGANAAFQGHLSVSGAQVDFTNLPTSDPSVAGRLWNDSGTVKISAG